MRKACNAVPVERLGRVKDMHETTRVARRDVTLHGMATGELVPLLAAASNSQVKPYVYGTTEYKLQENRWLDHRQELSWK